MCCLPITSGPSSMRKKKDSEKNVQERNQQLDQTPEIIFQYRILNELLPLDSNVSAKLTIILQIKKFSKSFLSHIGNIQ